MLELETVDADEDCEEARVFAETVGEEPKEALTGDVFENVELVCECEETVEDNPTEDELKPVLVEKEEPLL